MFWMMPAKGHYGKCFPNSLTCSHNILELGSTIIIIFILQINQENLKWLAQDHSGDQSLLLTPNICFLLHQKQ